MVPLILTILRQISYLVFINEDAKDLRGSLACLETPK
jgi:hypothetical protein